MKRDMDLVRNILLAIEGTEDSLNHTTLRLALKKPYIDDSRIPSNRTLVGHVEIMEEAGLVSANVIRAGAGYHAFTGLRMTWDGQDFLASTKDPSIWEKARPKFESLSFDLIKQLLIALAKETLLP